jgi:hypothetical protein
MNTQPDSSPDRVFEAGADILSIAEASVLVVVDDLVEVPPWRHPAWPLCRALAALGFGEIQLYGAEDCVAEFSDLMRRAMFTQIPHVASLARLVEQSARPDLVFYLGDDPATRDCCASAARAMRVPFKAVSWGASWLAMESSVNGQLSPRPSGFPPRRKSGGALPPIALVAAGLVLQETLIVAGRISVATAPEPLVLFNAASETRSVDGNISEWSPVSLEPAVLEVVGAGGIGTHLLESLAPLLAGGSELRIFDFDLVAPENLAVQSIFEPEDVGRPKAEVMAAKLAGICDPGVGIEPLVLRYEERPSSLSPPSIRVVCPDTFAARAYANGCSLSDGVPLVEAASSPLVGQQRTYLRGISSCLEHRIPGLWKRVAEEQDPASCGLARAIALPGTNMICGGLLALEALRALDPKRLGFPSAGTIVYDARFSERFGVTGVVPPCIH